MEEMPKDPVMLMSFVNMKLRDEFPTLEEFCSSFSVDAEALKKTLASAGFDWIPEAGQFR